MEQSKFRKTHYIYDIPDSYIQKVDDFFNSGYKKKIVLSDNERAILKKAASEIVGEWIPTFKNYTQIDEQGISHWLKLWTEYLKLDLDVKVMKLKIVDENIWFSNTIKAIYCFRRFTEIMDNAFLDEEFSTFLEKLFSVHEKPLSSLISGVQSKQVFQSGTPMFMYGLYYYGLSNLMHYTSRMNICRMYCFYSLLGCYKDEKSIRTRPTKRENRLKLEGRNYSFVEIGESLEYLRKAVIAGVGWLLCSYKKICAITTPIYYTDDAGHLHSEDSPAVIWPNWDSYKMKHHGPDIEYYWHGVKVDERIVLNPDSISPYEILYSSDPIRQIMLERYGVEKFFYMMNKNSSSDQLRADDITYDLHSINVSKPEPIKILRTYCDKTYKSSYFLLLSNIEKCKKAIDLICNPIIGKYDKCLNESNNRDDNFISNNNLKTNKN